MAEAVRVIVRCRPMNRREKDLKCECVVDMDGKIAQCSLRNPNDKKAPPKRFTFDGTYFVDSTTEQIYADIGFPLVEGVTEGFNGTIFAYGQTGCGKSFSMQGIPDPPTQKGIIPRAFEHIFETIEVEDQAKFLVHASYLEIYNEEIRDLLSKDHKKKLDLKEHPDKGVYVQDLNKLPCTSVRECEKIMAKGWDNRSVGATLMNADSSRSHSIFTIYMERCETDDKGEEHIRAAKLNLVDLAGSERQGKTGATGDRLKEATKINLSLSALGNVISALVDGKSKHIPYRDSKLTRMLQDSLGGNTKTLMVACLSPADNNYDETLSTLRYANRAKNIKNKPKINEDPKDALLREYQEEIKKLKAMLRGEIPITLEEGAAADAAAAPGKKKAAASKSKETVAMEPEKVERLKEYEEKMDILQQDYEDMRITNEKLKEEMQKLQMTYEGAAPPPGAASPAPPGAKGKAGLELASVVDDEEEKYVQPAAGQRAVHLKTVKADAPPAAQPGIEDNPAYQEAMRRGSVSTEKEAQLRLAELQQQMVGGDHMHANADLKEKHRKKKKHAEERKKKLQEALADMTGDEVMLEIYDNVQDELKVKDRLLVREKEQVESLQREIMDLQSEFEFDRIDYLDTIRKQEQQVKWLEAVIEKIHPCLRRDCNYINLDRVKAQSVWNEDEQRWTVPKLIIEKTKLPTAPGILPGPGSGRMDGSAERRSSGSQQNYGGDVDDDLRSEDRYLQKLAERPDATVDYFKSKRQDRLLNKMQDDKQRASQHSPQMAGSNFYANPQPQSGSRFYANPQPQSGSQLWQPQQPRRDSLGGMADDKMRAAAVHGQISPGDDFMSMRKPTRLESLGGPGGMSNGFSNGTSKKKKHQQNTMEQY